MFNSFLLYIILSPGSVGLWLSINDPFRSKGEKREMRSSPSTALSKRKEDDFDFNITAKTVTILLYDLPFIIFYDMMPFKETLITVYGHYTQL